jgi:Mg2+-importing ATPase
VLFAGSAIGVVTIALLLPFTPLGFWLGFMGPSASFFLYLAAAITVYLGLVEATKRIFYRMYRQRRGIAAHHVSSLSK